MNTWIFQGDAKIFNIDEYLASCTGYFKWCVLQNAKQIHPGDTVFLWKADSGVVDSGGILAECRVFSEVEDLPDEESIPFWKNQPFDLIQPRVILKMIRLANKKNIIKRSWLKDDSVLSRLQILSQPVGTNFPVTPEQAHRLSIIWQRTGVDWTRPEVIAALNLYEELWNKPISKNIGSPVEKLSQIIGRVPTGVYNKLMNFRNLDPRVAEQGLSGGSKVDRSVWAEFFDVDTREFKKDLLALENDRLWAAATFVEDLTRDILEIEVKRLSSKSLKDLLKSYEEQANRRKPTRKTTSQLTFDRDPLVVSIARKRVNHSCEIPDCASLPIALSNGENFIEVHHILPLASGGEDTIENVACLCPNHHREIHLGKHADALTSRLQELRVKE